MLNNVYVALANIFVINSHFQIYTLAYWVCKKLNFLLYFQHSEFIYNYYIKDNINSDFV